MAADDRNDIDELFDVKNAYYIGNYQNCINESSKLRNISAENQIIKDVFVYRSYIAQKKYKLVIDEINEKSDQQFYILKLLAQYLNDPSSRENIKHEIENYANPTLCLYKIVAASIFIQEKELEIAFDILYDSNDLECLAMTIQIYLQLKRVDLARTILLKMQAIDEDASLTQLSTAWIDLAIGIDKAQEAFYIFQDFCDKYTSSVILLNGLAAAHIHLKQYEEADNCLREALEKDSNNPETLINLIVTSQLLEKPTEICQRFINQLKDEFPGHPFVKEINNKELEFDKLAKIYMEDILVK
ncbi:unnamed protein product [Gordionus sp. m RMFG-2023]|uniref:coatomer subunit epsilon-like n=1 Tax=Gordionus sp. m RMFG-2023 TaxID=3053472 RepID=UPI0030E10E7D